MFLAFDVSEVLASLPVDFRKLMILGALISVTTAIVPMFWQAVLYQSEAHLHLPIFDELHLTTVTLFELGILLTVVGVIVTVMLSISGGKS